MRKSVFLVCAMLPVCAFAEPRDPRVGVNTSMVGRVPPVANTSDNSGVSQDRALVASKNQLMAQKVGLGDGMSPSIRNDIAIVNLPTAQKEEPKDMREEERQACLGGNVGVGNTFVWASRYSNTSNYASMQEDLENPENNVCFVKVDIRSSDDRIDLAGIPSKYFIWGDIINCGSWVDESDMAKRILDAKKKGRTFATIGGTVGGAAVGVGAMELFGNKLIDGKVQGQKNTKLSKTEVLRSQMLVLKQNNDSRYESIKKDLEELKAACAAAGQQNGDIKVKCETFDYDVLLAI